MNSRKVRFGILGTSRVALKGMLPAMRGSEFADLVMVGSRSFEKEKSVAEQFGVKKWGSYEDVLGSKEIDAIYISLPNALHEEWSIRALNAGKHVICEKPAAISYAAAKNMVNAAKRNNVRILEGLMFRYHPQNMKVLDLIRNGEIGEVLRFEGCFAFAMPDPASTGMNKNLGGGSFNDQFCYPIAASRMVFDAEPESVLCQIENDSMSGVSVKVHAMLVYPGGKPAFASSIFGGYYQSTYSILGTKGCVRMGRAYAVPRDMSTKVFLEKDDKTEEIIFPPSDHFRFMVEDFVREVLKGVESRKDYENDLLAEARVLEAARVSDKDGRVVKISEIQ